MVDEDGGEVADIVNAAAADGTWSSTSLRVDVNGVCNANASDCRMGVVASSRKHL